MTAARRKTLELLRTSELLTAILDPADILSSGGGEKVPPFVRLGAIAQPQEVRAACALNGGLVTFAAHAFAGPRKDDDEAVLETAESYAARIGHAISETLNRKLFPLADANSMRITLSDRNLMPDGDSDRFHWFAQVNARILAE